MRFVGRISSWNEDKGYGFVVPHGGGTRAFVHIKAFQQPSRRPVDGDLVSYAVAQDSRGRNNATQVRFAGQPVERRNPNRLAATVPRTAIAVVYLGVVAAGTLFGVVPLIVPAIHLVLGCVSYTLYYMDKAAAGRKGQRIPEQTLHAFDLFGGWPGALIAQQQYRHKTVKVSFQWAFWGTVAINLGLVAWLVHSGDAHAARDRLPGW